MEIRPVTEDHKETLFNIHEICFRQHIEEIWGWDNDWQWEYFCKEWNESDWRVLLHEEKVIGYLCWVIKSDHLYLQNISFIPEYQGLGLGSQAMDFIEDYAGSRNLGVKLSTFRTNNRALEFYEHRGYKVTEVVETGFRLSKGYKELISPKTEDDWDEYHTIREHVLFLNRGKIGVYQRNHPDEFIENHFSKLYKLDGVSIGTVRIDLMDEEVGFRCVAIAEDQQGFGYGSEMMQAAERFALDHSAPNLRNRFSVNSAKEAIGFYEKLGYSLDPEAKDNDPEHSKMTKTVSPANLMLLDQAPSI